MKPDGRILAILRLMEKQYIYIIYDNKTKQNTTYDYIHTNSIVNHPSTCIYFSNGVPQLFLFFTTWYGTCLHDLIPAPGCGTPA